MKELLSKILVFFFFAVPDSFADVIKVIPGEPPKLMPINTTANYVDYVQLGPMRGNGFTNYANVTGFAYGAIAQGPNAINCPNMAEWRCIDGYCGIPVNQSNLDVIYIPYGTTFSSFVTQDFGQRVSGSVTFNRSGNPIFSSAVQLTSNKACFSHSQYPQTFYINGDDRTTFTVSLSWYIYAAKSAASKIISADKISVTNVLGTSTDNSPVAVPANTIQVKPEVKCTISTPTVVDFHVIDIAQVTSNLIKTKRGDLSVNCSSVSATVKVDMNVSFKGNSEYSGDGRYLIMKNESQKPMAGIRGRITTPLAGSCVSQNSGDVKFDGSVASKLMEVSMGQTTIPIAWSLCKENYTLITGKGKAQATVTIDWE